MLQNLSKEALSGIQEVFFICFLGKFDNSCIERNWENPERHISNFKDTKRHHLIEISVFSRVCFFGQRGNWKICILVSSQECNLLSVPATDCRLHISNCKHAKLLHSNLERVGIFLPFTTRLHKHTHTFPHPHRAVFTFSISLQGQLSHLEPSQDDGSATAVLCHSSQRAGEYVFVSLSCSAPYHLCTHKRICALSPKPSCSCLITIASVAGTVTRLQLYVCWIPLPARQTVRRYIRHRWQSHSVWAACRYLQVLADVEGKGVL